MKVRYAASLASTLLAAVALIHLYWADGGTWAMQAAIPTLHGRALLHPETIPGRVGTLIVACTFLAMCVILAIRVGWIVARPLYRISDWATWGIAVLFALRAIGDFRYVGFFKTVRNSQFAKLDTWFYSPLCILLAVLVVFVAMPRTIEKIPS